ncbi:MAG: DUF6262 family protein [Acidimicrobiales bacterium]
MRMRADNTNHLREAARRKHEECLKRVTAAIHEADRLHQRITVQGVAKSAGVSSSWIYTQPTVYEAVRSRRAEAGYRSPTRIPETGGASQVSQQKRIELLSSRLRDTTEDNQRLRRELAVVHAELRRMRQLQPRQTVSKEP